MLKDFLIFGKLLADPWNRVHCFDKSLLVLIEFCQIQGPKPLLHYPQDVGPHLNLDQVAIWLMSSENVHGTQTLLYNQIMDLYAVVQHVTLLDITARAFQRPAALACISTEKPSFELRKEFYSLVNDLFRPLLACNRQIFRAYGETMVDVANEIQHERLNSYYSLASTHTFSPTGNKKLKQVAKQLKNLLDYRPREETENSVKPLNLQFLEMFRLVSCYPSFCNCGHDPNDFQKLLEIINEPLSSELIPFLSLAPCSGDKFKSDFCEVFDKLVRGHKDSGVLFSGGQTVLSTFSEGGYREDAKTEDTSQELSLSGVVDVIKISRQFPNENSLRCLGAGLIQCLYPLLSGEKMALIASEQRLSTGIDLLQKLGSLKISRVFENAEWSKGFSEQEEGYLSQLRGFTVTRNETDKFMEKTQRKVVIDLNNQKLYSQFYDGTFLQSLLLAKSFPSDQALILYIIFVLSDLCFYAQIAKRISLKDMEKKLKIKEQDVLIIANILAEYDMERFLTMRIDVGNRIKKKIRKMRF
ncbi:unnamed protein product [Bursaphelenchus okinawaensis]|uniref:UDENN FLCN/SMCR8-type domain-containing protein n=1 Tax=Bursaphelenchus okinawaensis TaxID=465554 RepID=A0A811KJY9_9BILA|nr:unnamed protein product [Bursaphelenchus okinawaensis]CAG9104047.1 unnamed protein product [Bursaphelenchus okinawaensis]